jgi:hypothetical protein
MLINKTLAALGFALLVCGAALGAERRGPCAADAKNFCYGVHPGDSRIYKCMMSHQAQLAPACRDRMKAINEKFDRVAKACESDAEKHCKGVPPGDGRILSCLKGHESNLDKACVRALKRARNDRSMVQ